MKLNWHSSSPISSKSSEAHRDYRKISLNYRIFYQFQRPTVYDGESRLLQCVQCGAFYPMRTTADGELVPGGGTPAGNCNCGSAELERVTLALSD